ncbi:hypothetical protein [Actinomadura rayongensis]|uniref:Uncharacterized protein n=1 Tax=Actinomadura rayongensis TaxID=1429076 RepID=A0A6I4W6J4_9ACTN|nr:hypothetical protein [Actinomadura rayongensis]MXQ64340.1 hypothetical protein [Actinomadura rayongensis]
MTTVFLVLLCLAVAGREMYLSFDKRLPRAQDELTRLRKQVNDLAGRQDALERDRPEPVPDAVPAAPPEPAGLSEGLADRLADRIARVEERLETVAARVDGLDLDRAAQRSLARSLDAVEQDVGELHQEMLERLARQEGVVSGLLLSEEGEAEALLGEVYERCAAEYGLRVRVRDRYAARGVGGSAFLGTSYRLSGRRPDALAEELFTFARAMYDPQDPSALAALLTELGQLHGGGVTRIGPFTAVRTANALVCGLLPDSPSRPIPTEPWELAAQLRELPEDLQCDLSWLRADA